MIVIDSFPSPHLKALITLILMEWIILVNPVIQRVRNNVHCKDCLIYEHEDRVKARDEALDLNERYVPDKIKVLFIAESPPRAFIRDRKAYFYASGPERVNSIAYHIYQVLFKLEDKCEFFERFKECGFYLIIDMVKCPMGGYRRV